MLIFDNKYVIINVTWKGKYMYNIVFYKDRNNKSEIEEYLIELQNREDKDSRININKIISYIDMLSKYGLKIGSPYIKYLSDNIWELRPIRNRILFTTYKNNTFILLTIFAKQTQKTPKQEIEKAMRYLRNFIERSE